MINSFAYEARRGGALAAFLVCLAPLYSASAQAVPENAAEKAYGGGWQCNPGFLEQSGRCEAIAVPENAHVTGASYGKGWACERRDRANGEACVAIVVPEHGYLVDAKYGKGWKCDRGYKASETGCLVVTPPGNAHINANGDDWECNRPYRRNGKTYVAAS